MPFVGFSLSGVTTRNRNWLLRAILCVSLLYSLGAAGQCNGGCCDNPTECSYPGSGEQCDTDVQPCACESITPIIVDTTGKGFHLTSAQDGVMFDFFGDNRPIRMAWTAAGSGNAFLALDRNHNGKIDNAKELFGNITEQPPSRHPNGFLALAEFDKPENGGNGDGIIDNRDAVFSRLLLWIDENHDGISQPNELHSLPELGVYSISLHYRDDQRYDDEYGNWFHYQAALNPNPEDGESKDGRLAFDVFFVSIDERGHGVRYIPDLDRLLGIDAVWTTSGRNPVSPHASGPPAGPQPADIPAGSVDTPPLQVGRYRSSLNVDPSSVPKIQIWNDSDFEITAVAVTVDLSNEVHQVESRTYYDTYVNRGFDHPIRPHQSGLISIGYAPGPNVAKMTPKVRAVVFSDGTAVGERVWTNAVMARRKHLYASLINLRGVLAEQPNSVSLKEVAEKLRVFKNHMHNNTPENEFRRVDDVVLDSAIGTFAGSGSTQVISSYLKRLEKEIESVSRSHFQNSEEQEVVPPHLDGRFIAVNRPRGASSADAWLGSGARNSSSSPGAVTVTPRLLDIANPSPTVTYTCTNIVQNSPSQTDCADPPTNNFPSIDLAMTAQITATNSQTVAKTTTTFSTSDTTTGMCEYYTDCGGDLVNDDFPGAADPSGAFPEKDGTTEGWSFWWVMIKYGSAASGQCNCSDPDPNGTVWNYTQTNVLTPTFWVAESGNTSSNCAGLVLTL